MRIEKQTTEQLVRDWEHAISNLKRAEQEVSSAMTVLHNAQNSLGKQLDPGDMKAEEEICCWARSSDKTEILVTVKKRINAAYDVSVRKRTMHK